MSPAYFHGNNKLQKSTVILLESYQLQNAIFQQPPPLSYAISRVMSKSQHCHHCVQRTEANIQQCAHFPGCNLMIHVDELIVMLFIFWYDSWHSSSEYGLPFAPLSPLPKCTSHHLTVLTSHSIEQGLREFSCPLPIILHSIIAWQRESIYFFFFQDSACTTRSSFPF